jgi:hypothetical protein
MILHWTIVCRWYIPNYDLAQELAWGRNRGCSIPHGSCAEHIQNQQTRFVIDMIIYYY